MNNSKPLDLYLVSSTLHFFWAWLLAAKNKASRDSKLWLIDQYRNRPLAFTSLLDKVETPFIDIKNWEGRELGGLKKYQQRKKDFNHASKLLEVINPERIFIGNDRSVFGQYILNLCKKNTTNSSSLQIIGLDDGVFSYLGRSASKSLSDRFIEQGLKKLTYGAWYDNPSSLGASKWIDQVWLMYPEYGNELLKTKNLKELSLNQSDLNFFVPIAKELMALKNINSPEAPDTLIALPNQDLIDKTPGYLDFLSKLIVDLKQKGKRIAFKHHPSAQGKDPLNLTSRFGVQMIDDQLSFEVLLAVWQDQKIQFIGDLSTTILLAHYFGFDSYWVNGVQTLDTKAMQSFCKELGIEQVVNNG